MHWTAREDRTLALSEASPSARESALNALHALRDCGDDDAHATAQALIRGLRGGAVQARLLAALGGLAHGQDAAREPAREASTQLFGFVLPTPTAGRAHDYFWRVARRLEQSAGPPPTGGAKPEMRFKTFRRRQDACAYATELGTRLVSITESQSGALLPVTTTLWFWGD